MYGGAHGNVQFLVELSLEMSGQHLVLRDLVGLSGPRCPVATATVSGDGVMCKHDNIMIVLLCREENMQYMRHCKYIKLGIKLG